MSAQLNIDQIRLLELYSSSEYFSALRDQWQRMVEHVENCLTSYLSNLPVNYRSQPLPEQPDIVWGHRVIPNFRRTLDGLNQGFILLTHGDTSGLAYAHSVRGDFKGQLEFWSGWMSNEDEKAYEDAIYLAVRMASNICFTEIADWPDLPVTSRLQDLELFDKNARRAYRISTNKFVHSGNKVEISGIYLPNVDGCCPQFLGTHLRAAPSTSVHVDTEDILDPETSEKYDERKIFKEAKCTWYLIESSDNIADESVMKETSSTQLIRIASGEYCPQSGFYFTPADSNSRRLFNKDDVMPTLHTDYGKTIWQWDPDQN